jgi:hypothetical protein
MNPMTKSFLILAAAACAAAAAGPAFARHGAKATRARADVAPAAGSAAEGADFTFRMDQKSNGRAEVRLTLEDAPEGLSPEAFIAGADGVLVDVGALAAQPAQPTEYRLRFRTKSGDALPAGAATIADLVGRAFEVREGDEVIVSGTVPALGTRVRTDEPGDDRGGGRGADDPANHDAGDDRGGAGGGGADDPAGHDANDDRGGGADDGPDHHANDDNGGGRGRGGRG